jgi:uncharacterized OB-fold protein
MAGLNPDGPQRTKPVPVPTPDSAPFWDGAKRGELCIQRCNECSDHYFYPRSGCPKCGSTDTTWTVVSGRGRLHSYLINHRPAPGFEQDAPYAIAIIELDEGPRMMSNIVGIANTPEALVLDMPLEVAFDRIGDVTIPRFRPAKEQP